MVNQDLINYIKESKEKGFSDEVIKKALLDVGWKEKDIEAGFKAISESSIPTAPLVEPIPSINKLPGPIALLRDTWDVYKSRFWTFIGITLIFIILPVILTIIGFLGGFVFIGVITSKFSFSTLILLSLLALLVALIVFLVQLWGAVSLIFAIKDREKKIGIIEAYKRGRSKLFSAWWIYILAYIIIVVGILAFLVPGIIFTVWFSLSGFILVAEGTKGFNALLKSKEYVKGQWWPVFGRFISIVLILLVISLIMWLIFRAIDISWLETIVNYIVLLLLLPLTITYSFLIYENLRLLKGEIVLSPEMIKKKRKLLIVLALVFLIALLGLSLVVGLNVIKGLRGAEERAKDAAIKGALSEARAAAEWHYDANGSYSGVCTADHDFARIQDIIIHNEGSWTCNDRANAYCVESSLNTGGYWCIDHAGNSRANATAGCTANSIRCPFPLDPQVVARDNQRVKDLNEISNVLEAYYRDHGNYPIMEMCLEVHSDGFPTYLGDGSIKWDSLESILQAGGHIDSLPEDPKKDPTSDYIYMYTSDGTNYVLSALLEGWHEALESDFDGKMGGCSFCDDPTYCIQSPK